MKSEATVRIESGNPGELILSLKGSWRLSEPRPEAGSVIEDILKRKPETLIYRASELASWDTALLTFLERIEHSLKEHKIQSNDKALPVGIKGMLSLARAIPEREDALRHPTPSDFFSLVGEQALSIWRDLFLMADFIGEICASFVGLLLGRSRMRACDFIFMIQESGPNALPIISLIGILMGMILAFVGAVQLKLFGAQIFIADLVGLGMAREMGAMMTAILMAGRTGSAFAAELGSMTVNDEIDALKTSGFSPIDFLVLPRVLAMFITIPFLCLYADLLGILGGAIVASGLFEVSIPEYFEQLNVRMRPIDFEVGIVKCAVFGILVAIAGCFRGLQCERNAVAVGKATTAAVVTGIVFIVISDAVMTLIITSLNLLRRG